jgi:tripeptide aminopeptidase
VTISSEVPPVSLLVVDQVVERTIEICAVPGPPLRESDRADVVERWWREDQLDQVTRDSTGNVWARIREGRGAEPSPAIVVCAHLDTVFDFTEPHGARRVGGRLCGPGVGDDSVALAALSTLQETLPADVPTPVWILGTVGEEGLGDLAGVRAALAEPVVAIGAVVAVEGNYLGRVCTTGVGSARWRVVVEGPGGHAWEAADAPSAVHEAARMVTAITELPLPADARCAVNVGLMTGGEAINSRARTAQFELDVRSDDAELLESLVVECEEVFARHAAGCAVTVLPIGRRPAGRIDPEHSLVRAAIAAQQADGIDPQLTAASTDANAAHHAGIPAVAIGITYGSAEHTHEEWIDLEAIPIGLRALAATVATYVTEGAAR